VDWNWPFLAYLIAVKYMQISGFLAYDFCGPV